MNPALPSYTDDLWCSLEGPLSNLLIRISPPSQTEENQKPKITVAVFRLNFTEALNSLSRHRWLSTTLGLMALPLPLP